MPRTGFNVVDEVVTCAMHPKDMTWQDGPYLDVSPKYLYADRSVCYKLIIEVDGKMMRYDMLSNFSVEQLVVSALGTAQSLSAFVDS